MHFQIRKRQSKLGARSSSNMEARSEHQSNRRFRVLYGISAVLGTTLALLVLVWNVHFRKGFTWQSNPALEFNWHPLLMVFGLICLYSQSMLIYRTGRNSPKKKLKLWHTGLHFVAFILSAIGLKAAFDSHDLANLPKPNLYTLHSWIGLITVIFFAAQFVAGFISFLYPGLPKNLRTAIMPVHRHSGVIIFVLAVVTAMMGLTEKAIWALDKSYAERTSEAYMINFIGLILVSFAALVLYLLNEDDYKRTAIPEDEISLTRHDE